MDTSYQFQHTNYLKEIFPNKSVATIQKVIQMVKRETPSDSDDYQLENIIDILMETKNDIEPSIEVPSDEEDLLDEATGITQSVIENNMPVYFETVLNIFPDACPTYVKTLCHKYARRNYTFDALIDAMTEVDYPKVQVSSKDIFKQIQEMLPKADPSYLEKQAESLAYASPLALKKFVEDAIENNDYPTIEDYIKSKKETEKVNSYTINFNIKEFLKIFPDPEKYFSNPKRKLSLAPNDPPDEKKDKEEELYALCFLYNHYAHLRKRDIDRVFKMFAKNLIKICAKLDTMTKAVIKPRKVSICETTPTNIPLLQEISYLKYRKIIKKLIKEYNSNYKRLKEEARANGLLQTCSCCFDDELIPEECYFCKNACIFCKDCVKNGAETVIGEGKLDFPCLADCGSEFSIPTLQMVLDSVVFSRMAQRKQMEEIKRANIDGLETCPFCDFATIPPPDSKIFQCLNADCKKESCRECRHVSHIPLRCNEIEYDEDVRMRTYIENKMTEALLRRCWKCNKVFIKESGCNKMTCSCGAGMCYVCMQPVKDYTHFDRGGLRCPLYTRDLNKFHVDAVIKGAMAAKADLGIDKNPNKLKKDPSTDLEEHYTLSH